MTEPTGYDVFIAYSLAEENWVHDRLKSELEEAGLSVATQEEFTPGHRGWIIGSARSRPPTVGVATGAEDS